MRALLTVAAAAALLTGCAGGTAYGPSGVPEPAPGEPAAAASSQPAAEAAEAADPHAEHNGAAAAPAAAGTAASGAVADPHAEHNGAAAAPATAGTTAAPAAPSDEVMAPMETLASWKPGDLAVELHAMAPELFYVSEGDGQRPQRPQRPTSEDDTHLMVTLADEESGVRLPDATVTARVTDAKGGTVFEGPLYPMVGRGMGLHYGENVELGPAGDYEVALTIGPPRVGRHQAVARAWGKTTRVQQKVRFDGRTVGPA